MDVLGRRWLTYVSIFWPTQWAHIIGGATLNVFILWVLAAYITVISYVKKKLKKEWIFLLLSLGGMIVLVRYTRTPLFSSFIVFAHPFILLLSAWIIYSCMKIRKEFGVLLLFTVIILSLHADMQELKPTINTTALYGRQMREKLHSLYPNETISIYDWNYETSGFSLPIVLYLDEQSLASSMGRKIGISTHKNPMLSSYTIISTEFPSIIDLSASTSSELKADKWIRVDADAIYSATEYWND